MDPFNNTGKTPTISLPKSPIAKKILDPLNPLGDMQ